MKRILFTFCIVALSVSLFAQKGKVTAAETMFASNDVDGAKKAIDEALVDEKSNTWPKTFIVAAKVYTKLYNTKKDDQGLMKSLGFYEKASEYDRKGDINGKGIGKYEKELTLALTLFRTDLLGSGVECFNTENFTCALNSFEGVISVDKMSNLTNTTKVDTAIVYNCALAAYNGKDWERSIKYFKQTIDLGYGGGDVVILLHQVYTSINDSVQMGENLTIGLTKYPNDDRILTTLINYYLTSHQNDKALEFLNSAIVKDPTNPSFLYARGVLNDQSKAYDKAEKDYLACLELDPNYFNALYNIGVLYYNKGVEKYNEASSITNQKDYEAAKKVANGYFSQALPFMEKAYAVLESKPDSSNQDKIVVLESLKNLYYRFDNMEKYDQMAAKIKELQQ